MKTEINSENTRQAIMRAYLRNPRVVDDDTLLLNAVWKRYGWSRRKTLLQNLRSVPSAETVRRTRQRMVEEGVIEPTVTATERRYNRFKAVKRALGYEKQIRLR